MQSAKYTVCGRTVRAKFKVQSAKCTQCVDSGPEISQWLSRFFSSFRASSPLWESNPWPYLTRRCLLGFGRNKIISKVISVLFSDECHLIVPTCCQAVHPHQQLVHPQSKKELPTHVLWLPHNRGPTPSLYCWTTWTHQPTPSPSHPVFTRMASGQPT